MSDQEQAINQPPPMFDPNAELEYLLAGAQEGKVSIVTVYQALLRAPVYGMFDRAMDTENLDPSGNALVLETGDMGKLLVLFTAPELSDKFGADLGEYVHAGQLSGEYVVSVLAEDTGLIVNPNHEFGMKVSAAGLKQLKEDFGQRGGPQGGSGGPPAPSGNVPSPGTPFN